MTLVLCTSVHFGGYKVSHICDTGHKDQKLVWHHWQVSENHMPPVYPSHAREIGQSVPYLTKHKIEL